MSAAEVCRIVKEEARVVGLKFVALSVGVIEVTDAHSSRCWNLVDDVLYEVPPVGERIEVGAGGERGLALVLVNAIMTARVLPNERLE